MTRRAARRKETEILKLVANNQAAMNEGPRRKTFSIQDMHKIEPLTDNQERAFEAWEDVRNDLVGLIGYAGTGKTFLAMYMALQAVLDKDTPYDKLVIVRSPVESGASIGFLPGSDADKLEPYEAPYKHICDQLFKFKKSYENLKEAGKIQFEPTCFLRGLSLSRCVILYDEIQNSNVAEFETVLTRVGDDCRIILCGDDLQNDIGNSSGFHSIVPILERTNSTEFIDFDLQDIVRSGFVKAYLMAKYSKNK